MQNLLFGQRRGGYQFQGRAYRGEAGGGIGGCRWDLGRGGGFGSGVGAFAGGLLGSRGLARAWLGGVACGGGLRCQNRGLRAGSLVF